MNEDWDSSFFRNRGFYLISVFKENRIKEIHQFSRVLLDFLV